MAYIVFLSSCHFLKDMVMYITINHYICKSYVSLGDTSVVNAIIKIKH